MSILRTVAAAAISLASIGPAHAEGLSPTHGRNIDAQGIDLGAVSGVVYYTVEPDGFRVVATSEASPFAITADDERRFYGVQFHPEVSHTPHGSQLLRNFALDVCGCRGDWTMAGFREEAKRRIRAQVGQGRVICGLSGGVDSSVAAALIHEAIGDQLTCIFVDSGLLREGEAPPEQCDWYTLPPQPGSLAAMSKQQEFEEGAREFLKTARAKQLEDRIGEVTGIADSGSPAASP